MDSSQPMAKRENIKQIKTVIANMTVIDHNLIFAGHLTSYIKKYKKKELKMLEGRTFLRKCRKKSSVSNNFFNTLESFIKTRT